MNQRKSRITTYFQNHFLADLTAGLTVMLIALPQSMAYAAIAGVNPAYGLFTAAMAAMVGALFGSSRFLITGPTNATAMATAGVLISLFAADNYAEFVFAIAILSGLLKMLFGIFNLGWLIRFISNAVLTGFLTGIGILIILNQLANFTGIPRPRGANAIQTLIHFINNIQQFNVYILVTSLLSLLVILIANTISKKIPAALLSIITGAVIVYFTGWNETGVVLIQDMSDIEAISFGFHLPQISITQIPMLLEGGIAIAILSLIEAMTLGKSFALSTGEKTNPSREMIGQGLASIASGFFQGIPSSASPARSTINFQAGAQTRVAGILSGGLILGAVYAGGQLLGRIPLASLAAVVIYSAINIVNLKQIKLTWQTRSTSRFVLVCSTLATLLFPIQYAIFFGIGLSILIYIYQSSQLKMTYLLFDKDFQFTEVDEFPEDQPITIMNVEGPLFFAAMEDLENQIHQVLANKPKAIILRLRHVQYVGSTGIIAMESLFKLAHQKNVPFYLSSIPDGLYQRLKDCQLIDLIGEERILRRTSIFFESTRTALKNALSDHLYTN
jgi:SulP family sulfate permease